MTFKIAIDNPGKAEMDKFLHGIVGVVEANSFESLCLWQENREARGQAWVSGGSGLMVQVGSVMSGDEELPVCMSLLVNEVAGHRILFVDVTSRGVDHKMVRSWLEANCPPSAFDDGDPRKRLNLTDAMNFPNVLPRERVAA